VLRKHISTFIFEQFDFEIITVAGAQVQMVSDALVQLVVLTIYDYGRDLYEGGDRVVRVLFHSTNLMFQKVQYGGQ
jgi:hypothetical protein